jgi:hypothetical protein
MTFLNTSWGVFHTFGGVSNISVAFTAKHDENVARYRRFAAIHDIAARGAEGAEKDRRLGA